MPDHEESYDEIIESLKDKEFHLQAPESIGKALIRRFAATVRDRNPLYWDDQYAGESPFGGVIAPPTFLFEVTYDIAAAIEEDGLYSGLRSWVGFDTSIQRAGNEYEMIRPVRPDDVVSLRKKVVDVVKKQGRTGSFILLTTETTYTNQKDELLGVDRELLALPLNKG